MHQQQPPQQIHMPQRAMQHSLHMHPHQQTHQQLPPAPMGNQMSQVQHSRQQQVLQQQQHHRQDMGRQISQPAQQQQQPMHHPASFMMPSPGMGYSDPRGGGGGGLGGLPVHNIPGSYHELPQQQQQPQQQQHSAGVPPSGTYGFQSAETHHKR